MTDESIRPNRFPRSVRFWLTLLSLATIFWLGGLTIRTLIGNEFFVTGTLNYEPSISLDQERTLFQLIAGSSLFVLINYAIVLVSSIVLITILPLKMKHNGWLLMASLMFFLFVPVEVFTGFLDIKFILLWERTKDILAAQGLPVYEQHSTILRATLSHRIGALGGLPVIATLSYFTAIVTIIWQPLKRPPRLTTGTSATE